MKDVRTFGLLKIINIDGNQPIKKIFPVCWVYLSLEIEVVSGLMLNSKMAVNSWTALKLGTLPVEPFLTRRERKDSAEIASILY